tara:strand:- start:675 stop:1550 length:876 start_codon:yes stop_codon:yes gene_type:complete
MNKLALGTAQFGIDYGINSISGKVKTQEIEKILHLAKSENINLLDTAASYGDSEKILGQMDTSDFQVVTKIKHFDNLKITDEDILIMKKDFDNSLQDLKLDSVYGLLVHNADDLTKPGAYKILEFLQYLKNTKKINKIGVSVYENAHLNFILQNFDIDMVQLPLNIFDRRFIDSGVIKLMYSQGIEIHARSIFLQGLILMPNTIRHRKFNRWKEFWKIWDDWLNDNKISPLEASVRYALQVKQISRVLVGIDSVEQLTEIVKAIPGFLPSIPDEMYIDDVLLLNPSNWDSL